MRISPVSFGSLFVFTLKDNKKKSAGQESEIIPQLMKVSFNNNPSLKKYELQDLRTYSKKLDGTVYNAASNLATELDLKYQKQLPRGSNKVILTAADFYINPHNPELGTEKKYFLTAATTRDEKKIHKALSKSTVFYVERYGTKC